METKEKGTDTPAHQPGTRKGEEMIREDGKEPGRHDTGTSETGRPHGKSTGRDSTSIDPEGAEPIDPASPHLPTA